MNLVMIRIFLFLVNLFLFVRLLWRTPGMGLFLCPLFYLLIFSVPLFVRT